MNRLLIFSSALLALSMVTSDVVAQQKRGGGGGQGRGQASAATQIRSGNQGFGQSQRESQGRLSSGIISTNNGGLDLLRMREEEKLARDVYTSLAKTSGLTVFQNIARAENQHMQAVERLIGGAGANGNAMNNVPGTFAFPDYQQLYQTLVASGTRSPLDALMVGAKIEEMDITDLRRVLVQTTNPQVQQVLGHLLQGSQNHLRAFASQIAQQGATYNAEFLTQAEFDQIAQSSGRGQGQQSGGLGPNSSGQGSQGQGKGQQHGFQGQNPVGQGFGGANQNGQPGGKQAGGGQPGGKQGRGK